VVAIDRRSLRIVLALTCAGTLGASAPEGAEPWSPSWCASLDRRIAELASRSSLRAGETEELVRLVNERARWRNPGDRVLVPGGPALGFAGMAGRGGARRGRSAASLAARSRSTAGSIRSSSSASSSASRSSGSRTSSLSGSSMSSSLGSSSSRSSSRTSSLRGSSRTGSSEGSSFGSGQ
jgi:hypothetical protein